MKMMNIVALKNIICATRASIRLAAATQELLHNKGALTEADEIAGRLKDALYYLSEGLEVNGEELDDPAREEYINRLLDSALPDSAAAETLIYKCGKQKKQSVPAEQCTFKEMWDSLGSYLYKAVKDTNDH